MTVRVGCDSVVDLLRLLAELLDRDRDVGVDTTVGLDRGGCCWVGSRVYGLCIYSYTLQAVDRVKEITSVT